MDEDSAMQVDEEPASAGSGVGDLMEDSDSDDETIGAASPVSECSTEPADVDEPEPSPPHSPNGPRPLRRENAIILTVEDLLSLSWPTM